MIGFFHTVSLHSARTSLFLSGIATDRHSVYCFCVVLTNIFGFLEHPKGYVVVVVVPESILVLRSIWASYM